LDKTWRHSDVSASMRLQAICTQPLLYRMLAVIARSGDSWLVFAVLVVAWWVSGFEHKSIPLMIGVSATAASAMAGLAKQIYRRRRPVGVWGAIYRRTDPLSFPSGHAARTLAIAVMIWVFFGPVYGLIAAAWSIAVGLSRVALAVHWLSDVLAGWMLGLLVGGVCLVAQQACLTPLLV
jgi:undecaprenyl-diphosphatase